jgi:transposase
MPMPQNPAQAAARRAAAWEYALKGKSERQIAELLERDGLGKVSPAAVHKMLVKVREDRFNELKDKADHQRTQQTDALWRLYHAANEAWERSWKPTKTLTTKQGEEQNQNASVTIRDGTGDPRYLQTAMQALADIRKIWGLDAPKKIAPTSPDGTKEYGELSDTDRAAALANLYARVGAASGGADSDGQAESDGQVLDRPGEGIG